MSSYAAICQRLPALYRPDDDEGLFARFLQAAAALIDETDRESAQVMQAHWFRYADDPRFDLFLNLFERAAFPEGAPEQEKKKAQEEFDIICDLARIASIFRIHPWKSAKGEAETVAQFRKRVSEIIDIYRNGLGTRQAIEMMTRALLPGDEMPDFRLQEFVLSQSRTLRVEPSGIPSDRVGPLMRWTVKNRGVLPSVPTIFIEGLAAGNNQEEAVRPEIELFSAGGGGGRVAIACETSLPPGKTLCISPVYNSWIAAAHGIMHAEADQQAPLPDITASGPWSLFSGVPAGQVKHLVQTADMRLWAVVEEELHSFDGASWTKRAEGLAGVNALVEQEDMLLVCCDMGVVKIDMYQAPPSSPEAVVPDPSEPAVFCLTKLLSGQWWAGCSRGVRKWDGNAFGTVDELPEVVDAFCVRHIFQDSSGTVIMATDRGVLLFQPALGHLYLLTGGQSSDSVPDWTRLQQGDHLPADDAIFMPEVNAVMRGQDADLWFGTAQGIACYRATPVRGLSYRTHLTAFPELGTGAVRTICEDQAGILWFCCENGLFRYDHVRWQRFEEDRMVTIPDMEERMDDARPWRFHRATGAWQVYDHSRSSWITVPESDALSDSIDAHEIIWTTGAAASLGNWNQGEFQKEVTESTLPLRMRYKPVSSGERRIVEGGMPGIPALPPGESVWRYLRLEDEEEGISSNRPTWTSEGRLVPPPEDAGPALSGRFSSASISLSDFDQSVFAFLPCARVWFRWQARDPLTMQVRIDEESLEPSVIDRLWQGIQQVRPAGSKVELVVNSRIARGETNG